APGVRAWTPSHEAILRPCRPHGPVWRVKRDDTLGDPPWLVGANRSTSMLAYRNWEGRCRKPRASRFQALLRVAILRRPVDRRDRARSREFDGIGHALLARGAH